MKRVSHLSLFGCRLLHSHFFTLNGVLLSENAREGLFGVKDDKGKAATASGHGVHFQVHGGHASKCAEVLFDIGLRSFLGKTSGKYLMRKKSSKLESVNN